MEDKGLLEILQDMSILSMEDKELPEILRKMSMPSMWNEQQPRTINPIIANLKGAYLRGIYIIRASTNYTNFFNVDLSGANLKRINLQDADLSGANLSGANLKRANLSIADFRYANLSGANLSNAVLSDANFFNADLSGANLTDTNLSRANLRSANLSNANLVTANLSNAVLSGANLSGARIGQTLFGDQNLRRVKGLETIKHERPSPLSINTIYKSGGDVTEVFVQGTGAPDSFIEYMHALARKPIEYYSCFISYSSKDQAIAERLYNDLQGNGVRCWYAPKDLKPGDFYRDRIDESIRVYEKVLLILSEHSVKSKWVEKEVEQAWKREGESAEPEEPLVLFPIRVDDTVMQTERSWARQLRYLRHIGDFTGWKDHDAYQEHFQQLLRDLKQERPKTKP